MSVKRKPGRPKKQRITEIIPKHGVVEAPINVNCPNPDLINAMEILYENPLMFKKIFNLLKTLKVADVPINFYKDEVIISTKDHTGENIIHITIHGDKLNTYYCEEPYSITIALSEIEPELNAIDKEYTAISFKSQRLTKRSKFTLSLKYHPMVTTPHWDITVEQGKIMEENVKEMLAEEENYPVKFTLPSKFLKKRIKDYSTRTKILKIKHIGGKNLCFNYISENNKTKHNWPFKNDNIKLESKIPDGELFIAPVYISNLKPILGNIVVENLAVSADKYKRMIFTAKLDCRMDGKKEIDGSQVCTIKILTKLVEFKK